MRRIGTFAIALGFVVFSPLVQPALAQKPDAPKAAAPAKPAAPAPRAAPAAPPRAAAPAPRAAPAAPPRAAPAAPRIAAPPRAAPSPRVAAATAHRLPRPGSSAPARSAPPQAGGAATSTTPSAPKIRRGTDNRGPYTRNCSAQEQRQIRQAATQQRQRLAGQRAAIAEKNLKLPTQRARQMQQSANWSPATATHRAVLARVHSRSRLRHRKNERKRGAGPTAAARIAGAAEQRAARPACQGREPRRTRSFAHNSASNCWTCAHRNATSLCAPPSPTSSGRHGRATAACRRIASRSFRNRAKTRARRARSGASNDCNASRPRSRNCRIATARRG